MPGQVTQAAPALRPQKSAALKYLTTEMAASVSQGWKQTQTDQSITGSTLSIARHRYEHGLGIHAAGEMLFTLGQERHRFQAQGGIDDGAGAAGSVVFKVLFDGREAFNRGTLKAGQAPRAVALDVSGVDQMRLIVTDAGDGVQGDHADWAEAAVDRLDKDDRIAVDPVPQFSTAGFLAEKNSPRQVWSFNPGWRFLKPLQRRAEPAAHPARQNHAQGRPQSSLAQHRPRVPRHALGPCAPRLRGLQPRPALRQRQRAQRHSSRQSRAFRQVLSVLCSDARPALACSSRRLDDAVHRRRPERSHRLGYDFRISPARGVIERNVGPTYKWSSSQPIARRRSERALELLVPLKYLGLAAGARGVDFKRADSCFDKGDWSDFTLNGDAAPNDRFSYRARW